MRHIGRFILAVLIYTCLMMNMPCAYGQANDPDPPVIDSVSVDTTDDGTYRNVIGWQPYDWSGYDTDSSGFIIREVIPGSGYAFLDTIYSATQTFFVDRQSDPFNNVRGYGLVAYSIVNDTLLKSTIADQGSRNMRLKISGYDSCESSVTLHWNTYYRKEVQQNDPLYHLTAVFANDTQNRTSNDTIYTFTQLNANKEYRFKVHISTENYSSTSNPVWQWLHAVEKPTAAYFELLKTFNDFSNSGTLVPDAELTDEIIVFRALTYDGEYDTIFQTTEDIGNRVDFSDADVGQQVAYYYTESFSACGIDPVYSDTINTILLNGQDNGSFIGLNANRLFHKDADYFLYREADGNTKRFDLGEPPLVYNDFGIFNQTLQVPVVRYYVEALLGDSATVRSNTVKLIIKDDLRWPNTIIAGDYGIDGVFRAFPQRSLPEEFHLKIFNKWGELLFETHDIEEGWDAQYKGNYVMPGAYLYKATYKFPDRPERVVRGTVTVVH